VLIGGFLGNRLARIGDRGEGCAVSYRLTYSALWGVFFSG
jgi:hypothetical protein